MTTKHERMARIEGIDLDTGTIAMTLATEGEASDGNILSIAGGQIPERIPFQVSHINDPTFTLGSITNPEKLLKDSPPRLRAVGQIEMDGEETGRSIRRDLAHMIDKGHVTGVSIRWEDVPGKTSRRVNLPSDHPYYVPENEKDSRKRYGMYFDEWVAMEGSLVALPADKGAVIGRAEETEGEVQAFWRSVADDMEGLADESPEAKIAASLAGLRIDANDCREAGAATADLVRAVLDGASEEELQGLMEREPEPAIEPEPLHAASLEVHDADEPVPVSREEMEYLLERLDALEAATPPTLEEERVLDEPLPSPIEEREVKADPLSASRPLEAIEQCLAETNLHLQAKILRSERKDGASPLVLARMLKEGLAADRREVLARFHEKVELLRGKVRKHDEG